MTNPWLSIPEADYVGHMNSPAVGQRAVLARVFGETVRDVRPAGILVIGCANGNGFEHIDSTVTRGVTCVEINDSYLTTLRRRSAMFDFEIDARCADIMTCAFERESFELIHDALVFEYVEWRELLPRVASWLKPGGALKPGGTLSVVLQRPSTSSPAVTPTPFTSLLALESIFRFVEPDTLIAEARLNGLELAYRRTEPLPSGKAFEVLRLRKPQAQGFGASE